MGRSGRKGGRGKSSLRVGLDLRGRKRQIGEKDSEGKVVGFIDERGNCWQSRWEHDLVETEVLYDEAMTRWEHGLADKPNPVDIARSACADESHVREAALLAERNREMLARFRGFNDEDGERWPSVWEHDRRSTLDSFLDAMEEWEGGGHNGPEPSARDFAEENCINRHYIDKATEEAEREWEYMVWKRKLNPLGDEDGESSVYPGIIPGSRIEVMREGTWRLRRQAEDEFERLVEDVRFEGIDVWRGSFSYHVDALGHTVSLSTVRSSSSEAEEAGRKIEEAVMHGELYLGEAEARVALEAESPEEQQEAALRRLSEGNKRKELRILEALGLDPEIILRRDRAIASGEHWERPLALVEAPVFLPDIGEVSVLASGRDNKEALSHIRKVLPEATLS